MSLRWKPGRPAPRILMVLIVALCTACGPTSNLFSPADHVEECYRSLPPAPVATGVFVEPDDGRDPVLDEIRAAGCGIDVSMYLLSDDETIGELIAASARGVRVRVMLEEHPFGGGGGQDDVQSVLKDGGVEVKWSGSDIRFSHAKYMVVDRQITLILNQNLTNASFETNREFGSITTERHAVTHSQRIFDADWSGEPVDAIDGPLIVSPTSSRARYLALINGATVGIDFYAEVIRDPQIIAALSSAEARGVDVRLIVNEGLDEEQQAAAVEMYAGGVEIRLASGLYIHAKLMLIDGRVAIVGSQNFTATSLDQNRELAMVLENPALVSRCSDIFGRDWIQAVPGAPADRWSIASRDE